MIVRLAGMLLLLCAHLAAGAQDRQWVLKGNLNVGGSGGEVANYELHFDEGGGGNISGYALIYFQPGRDSRAPIVGKLDRAAGTLTFNEESIDYNNGFESKYVICLVRATLHYNPRATAGRIALSGPTVSSNYARAECAQGQLNFTADSSLARLFGAQDGAATANLMNRLGSTAPAIATGPAPTATPRPAAPKSAPPPPPPTPPASAQPKPASQPARPPVVAKATPPPPVQHATPPQRRPAPAKPRDTIPKLLMPKADPPKPKPVEPQVPTITAGTDLTLDWESDTLLIEVWDGGRIDNDQINLVYANRVILSRYTLTANKKAIAVPVAPGESQLRILAVSEGSEPPNTANIMLTDGKKTYPLVAHNTVGKVATIVIRKKG